MKTRELSHLAQTATDPTVGFEYIVQQAQELFLMPAIKKINETNVYESPTLQRPPLHARMPGIAQLPSGELVAMYELTEVIDKTLAYMYVSRSKDLGETWQFQGEMYDTLKENVDFQFDECVKPLVLADGTLIAVGYRFNRPDLNVPIVNPETGGFLWGPNVVSFSKNNGKTWTVTEPIDCGVPETLEIAGSAIQARSGDIIAIGGVFKKWDGSNPTGQVGIFIRSKDNGIHWQSSVYYQDHVKGTTPYEARLCEMQDKRLVAIVWAYSHKEELNYPNHVVVSHDNGTTWSDPIDTGHMAQSTGVMWVRDELLMTIHCHRAGEDVGLYARLVDFTNDKWNVLEELLIWRPEQAQSNTGTIADQVGALEFGQPELLRLHNGDILAYHWGKENSLAKIKAHRLKLNL